MNNNNNIIEVKFVACVQKVQTWTVKIMKYLKTYLIIICIEYSIR